MTKWYTISGHESDYGKAHVHTTRNMFSAYLTYFIFKFKYKKVEFKEESFYG